MQRIAIWIDLPFAEAKAPVAHCAAYDQIVS
jgi:hypothetical protein